MKLKLPSSVSHSPSWENAPAVQHGVPTPKVHLRVFKKENFVEITFLYLKIRESV
jgi:hypothetical protein